VPVGRATTSRYRAHPRETSKRGPPPPEQRDPAQPPRRETLKRGPTRARLSRFRQSATAGHSRHEQREPLLPRLSATLARGCEALGRGRVGEEQQVEQARRIEVGQVGLGESAEGGCIGGPVGDSRPKRSETAKRPGRRLPRQKSPSGRRTLSPPRAAVSQATARAPSSKTRPRLDFLRLGLASCAKCANVVCFFSRKTGLRFSGGRNLEPEPLGRATALEIVLVLPALSRFVGKTTAPAWDKRTSASRAEPRSTRVTALLLQQPRCRFRGRG
jgi:hypothetical protein